MQLASEDNIRFQILQIMFKKCKFVGAIKLKLLFKRLNKKKKMKS